MEFKKILLVVLLLAAFLAAAEARFIMIGHCATGHAWLSPFGCITCEEYLDKTGENCPEN